MIYQQIKEKRVEARKAKDVIKSNLLTTVLSEIEMVAKNDGQRDVVDGDCITVVRKFKKNLLETIKIVPVTDNTFHKKAGYEISILDCFLPIELSEGALTTLIESIVIRENLKEVGMKAMGQVMSELKRLYAGQYDGKLASKLVREALSK